jgi:hypothetical protein
MDNKLTWQFVLEGYTRAHHRPHFPQNGLPLIADFPHLQAILNTWLQYDRAPRRQVIRLYLNLHCENRWLDRGCPDISKLDHPIGKSYHPLILLVGYFRISADAVWTVRLCRVRCRFPREQSGNHSESGTYCSEGISVVHSQHKQSRAAARFIGTLYYNVR